MQVYIDIETTPQPIEVLRGNMPVFKAASNIKDSAKKTASIEAKQQAYVDRAALSPSTGMVLAIGLYDEDKGYRSYVSNDPTSKSEEAKVLQAALDDIKEAAPDGICGWNIAGFDMPFLIRRCWSNRLRVPFLADPTDPSCRKLGRYMLPVVDLMTFMAGCYEWRHLSLRAASLELGLETKVDLNEALPYDVYHSDRQLFDEYLKRDVCILHEIAEIIIP